MAHLKVVVLPADVAIGRGRERHPLERKVWYACPRHVSSGAALAARTSITAVD